MSETNSNLKCCHLLLEEASGQPQKDMPVELLYALQSPPKDMTSCINLLNAYRVHHHWPLASGMTALAVDLSALETQDRVDFDAERAQLQAAMIALFKKESQGIEKVSHALGQINLIMAKKLQALLENLDLFIYAEPIFDCLKRFDLLLKDYKPDEKLYVDICFYEMQLGEGAPTWSSAATAEQHLQQRIQLCAQQLASLLKPEDNEAVLAKEKIWPAYLSLTDGLLFAHHYELRARIEARFQKLDQLDDPMLLIAVPAQKLWAECARLSVTL